jgi:hypothetical protein
MRKPEGAAEEDDEKDVEGGLNSKCRNLKVEQDD